MGKEKERRKRNTQDVGEREKGNNNLNKRKNKYHSYNDFGDCANHEFWGSRRGEEEK